MMILTFQENIVTPRLNLLLRVGICVTPYLFLRNTLLNLCAAKGLFSSKGVS